MQKISCCRLNCFLWSDRTNLHLHTISCSRISYPKSNFHRSLAFCFYSIFDNRRRRLVSCSTSPTIYPSNIFKSISKYPHLFDPHPYQNLLSPVAKLVSTAVVVRVSYLHCTTTQHYPRTNLSSQSSPGWPSATIDRLLCGHTLWFRLLHSWPRHLRIFNFSRDFLWHPP